MPAAVVEVLGVAVGVVLEGGRDGRPAGVAADDALALPHQPPEQPSPRAPAAAAARGVVPAGEQLEARGAPAHARRQPRWGGHAAREVGGLGRRRGRLAVHVQGHGVRGGEKEAAAEEGVCLLRLCQCGMERSRWFTFTGHFISSCETVPAAVHMHTTVPVGRSPILYQLITVSSQT